MPRVKLLMTIAIAVIAPVLIFLAAPSSMAAESNSESAVAPGTVINHQNWRNFRQYMPDSMQTLWQGNTFWHLPADATIVIGPTGPIPSPNFFRAATEKNQGTSSFKQLPDAGYITQNYRGGTPYPNPLKGNPAMAGERIYWDMYYRYHPRVEGAVCAFRSLDSYGNKSRLDIEDVYSQLSFVTDPGFPPTDPNAGPYYYTTMAEQIAPEAGKYTTTLILEPTDPTAEWELYAFIPTLRRSLRLSQSARCAPVFGTDLTNDDMFSGPPGLPQLFSIKYLGTKKILTMFHANKGCFDSLGGASDGDPKYFFPGGKGELFFLKPACGDWELRDVYVLSLKRLPAYAPGYCYGNRVIYVDQQNYYPDYVDLYDPNMKLFKGLMVFLMPNKIPGAPGQLSLNISSSDAILANFQDKHASLLECLPSCTDRGCDSKGYEDATRWAVPEGLMKIMQ
ncbi:MAG: DUF1329 domain-containing protein [Candidatus Binataceae bacterium]